MGLLKLRSEFFFVNYLLVVKIVRFIKYYPLLGFMTKGKRNIERLIGKAMNLISQPPGKVLTIEGIPGAITQEHNELFYYWQRFRNATVVRIDAHPDMSDGASPKGILDRNYHKRLAYTEFSCAGVHYGNVSSVYWVNPHEAGEVVHDFGSVGEEEERPRLETTLYRTERGIEEIRWVVEGRISGGMFGVELHRMGQDKEVTLDDIKIEEDAPFIVDGDLDGFCCNGKNIYGCLEGYDGVSNWEQRIEKMQGILKSLRKPNFIGITRSQGRDTKDRYVPPGKVDEVEKCFIASLKEIYSK